MRKMAAGADWRVCSPVLIRSNNLCAALLAEIAPRRASIAECQVEESLDGVHAIRRRIRWSRPFVQTGKLLTGKHRLGWYLGVPLADAIRQIVTGFTLVL
jgi:hypothetical protein